METPSTPTKTIRPTKMKRTVSSSNLSELKTPKKAKKCRRPKWKRYCTWLENNKMPTDHITAFEAFELAELEHTIGKQIISFGKFKGKSYVDLWENNVKGGRSYLEWLEKQDTMFDDVRQVLTILKEQFSKV